MRNVKQKKGPFGLKPTLVATLAALATLAGTPGLADDGSGKRRDNARLESRDLPPPGEWQPDFSYPLPSGVSRTDALVMRAAPVPQGEPQGSESISEAALGALFASGR